MRVAVVGHTEWIQFARVPHVPAAGDIVQASRAWEEPGGGGGVAAVQLASLAGSSTFFTALGDDDIGRRLERRLAARGVHVVAAWRDEPQRRAVTFVDDRSERTITLLGPKLTPRGDDALPWDALDGVDAVYFTGREAGALRQARRATVLVATARELATLREAGVVVDALVSSAIDPSERYEPGALDPPPRMVVATRGADGGEWSAADGARGTYAPATPPGPVVDTYGAGDCFAAGLTFALGRGDPLDTALAVAARCGAYAITGPGVHVAPAAESRT
ncbi:MAG: PfkB family carbohydrate kinase [Gaiellaceae bacterium]